MKTDTGNKLFIAFASLLFLALCAWGAVWFMENYERHEREIRSNPAPEARRNPLLAAERFLRRRGISVESLSGRSWLTHPPQEPGVLLVHHLGPSLAPEREEELLAWVSRGGHLVVVADQVWDEDTQRSNSLLDRLGVHLHSVELDDDDERLNEDNEIVVTVQTDNDVAGNDSAVYEVTFRADRFLEDTHEDAAWTLADEDDNVHLLEWAWDNGWITVLSDDDLFTNDRIGKHDNAWFLGYLFSGEEKAFLLYSSNMPSLLTLFWRHAPYLLVSLLLLLLLSIWHLSQRSGPVFRKSARSRRNLMEHLHAAAAYAWRIDKARSLFAASQARIEQDWRRRHPLLDRLERPQRCQWIARKTGLEDTAVDAALYSLPDDEQMLIRLSALQQQLIKHLSRKSNR